MTCFIDEKTYNELRGTNQEQATAKKPLSLEQASTISPVLADTIARWKKERRDCTKEIQSENPIKISTTILSVYKNNEMYKILPNNILVLLAGEAYAAVPFFRSINMCLRTVEHIVNAIEFFLNHSDKPKDYQNQALATCVSKVDDIINNEISSARLKNTGLNMYRTARPIIFGALKWYTEHSYVMPIVDNVRKKGLKRTFGEMIGNSTEDNASTSNEKKRSIAFP